MTRARPAADEGASRPAALAPRALLALVVLAAGLWPALVEASLPGAAATVASDSRAVAALDHLTLSAVADPTNASGFALFAGDELGRALDQGDDAARFALGIAPEELDVAGLALVSRVRELGFRPLQGLDLIDAEPLRGPPEREPKTRIGGLELSEPFLQREKPRLSLGLRWGCGPDSCEIATEQRFDPLGLATVPGSRLDTMMRQRFAASKRAQADASNDLRELAWLLRPRMIRSGITDSSYYGDLARALKGLIFNSLSAGDRPDVDVLNMGMAGIIKAPSAVAQVPRLVQAAEAVTEVNAVERTVAGPLKVALSGSESTGMKAGWTLERAEEWLTGLKAKNTPTKGPKNLFEIAHTGPENRLVEGGGTAFWTDGIVVESGTIQEAKMVVRPKVSPFISGTAGKPEVKKIITDQVRGEFQRMSEIIGDSNNPLTQVEVIVNDARATPFFEGLLKEYGIPGRVVVKP